MRRSGSNCVETCARTERKSVYYGRVIVAVPFFVTVLGTGRG